MEKPGGVKFGCCDKRGILINDQISTIHGRLLRPQLLALAGNWRVRRMVLLDAALLPPQFRNVEGQPDAKSPKGMYGKPGTRRRPKPAPTATFDGWTLLGIVAFTHILDAGALLLALTERARRLPLETHAPEQALASILRAPPQ